MSCEKTALQPSRVTWPQTEASSPKNPLLRRSQPKVREILSIESELGRHALILDTVIRYKAPSVRQTTDSTSNLLTIFSHTGIPLYPLVESILRSLCFKIKLSLRSSYQKVTPMANTLINVGGLVASLLPLAFLNQEKEDLNKITQITLGIGSNPNADGSVPHIAVFDAKGGRIGQFKGNKNGHVDRDRTVPYTINNDQNGGKPAKPEYISIVMHENDGICIAAVAAAGDGVQWAWTGDVGYTCGAQWYPSRYTMGNYNQPIRCVWLDANHDNGIIAKGLSLHIRDFSGEPGMLAQYQEDERRLCQNSARMTFHPDFLPDSLPKFFNPPLKYMRETNANDPTKPSTAGALEKPNQGRDRQTRAYPDGTEMNSRRLRRRQTSSLKGQGKLKIRGIKNLHPDRLTVSHMKGHSAKELCLDEMSLGPDFVSTLEGAFCDMATATWWPLCTAVQTFDCFDLETKTIRTSKRTRDMSPEKKYTYTDEWK